MKKVFFHGLTTGILSAFAAIIFNIVYTHVLGADFSKIINPVGLVGANLIGCLLASLGYFFYLKTKLGKNDFWFNLLFAVSTIVTCAGPFTTALPLDISTPELFPGLTIPMHFFPIVFWMVTQPLFYKRSL